MRFLRVPGVVLVVLALGGGCWGGGSAGRGGMPPQIVQVNPPPTVPAERLPVRPIRFGPPAPQAAPAYQLHTGDELEISIWGEPDMTRTVTVLPSEQISYAGEYGVRAAGRTEEEVARELERRLARFYVSPRVSVRVVKATGNAMVINGVVRRPGLVRVDNESTITTVVALAGGILPGVGGEFGATEFELADLERAWLRRGSEYVDVDFKKLFRGTREEQLANDARVLPGDKLYIPSSVSLENKVFLLGQIGKPQVIRYRGDIRFIEALAEAQIQPHGARWRGIALVRNALSADRECRVVNAAAIVRGRSRDFKLAPGDIIYVPRTPFRAVVDIVRDLDSIFSAVRSSELTYEGVDFDDR